jgi:glycosyltransferase involved in cell wall biosynthesis
MKIFFDNIVFSLQKAGGVSKNWSKLLSSVSADDKFEVTLRENKSCRGNLFYPLDVVVPQLENDWLLSRYLPIMNAPKEGVFHSSYYRGPFRKNDLKMVTTIHDFMYEKFDSGLRRWVHKTQKKNSLDMADAIICVSESTKNDLFKIYPECKGKRVEVIPNGVDDEFGLVERSESIEMCGSELFKENYYLYVGKRNGCKNFVFLRNLFERSPDLRKSKKHLVCVGGGPFLEEESREWDRVGRDFILHYENLSNQDLNLLYNHASCLFFPSKYEGFGIPALEAQLAGCPVLYAETSSMPEVMAYKEMAYGDDDIDGAIEKLLFLETGNIRKELIAQGVDFAKKFSWRNMGEMTKELYRDIYNG